MEFITDHHAMGLRVRVLHVEVFDVGGVFFDEGSALFDVVAHEDSEDSVCFSGVEVGLLQVVGIVGGQGAQNGSLASVHADRPEFCTAHLPRRFKHLSCRESARGRNHDGERGYHTSSTLRVVDCAMSVAS